MKAVVFHGIGDIRLDTVQEPKIKDSTDAIIRLTLAAICGTDLHFVRGAGGEMKAGTVLGHEGVGVIEDVGPMVRNLKPGDRVVVPRQLPAEPACIAEPAITRSATMLIRTVEPPAPPFSAAPSRASLSMGFRRKRREFPLLMSA